MRPRSIEQFSRFYLSSAAIALTNLVLHYSALRQMALDKGGSPAGPLIAIAFMMPYYWALWFFIMRRASNIAKWILVVGISYQPVI